MATVRIPLPPTAFVLAASGGAQWDVMEGSNFPVPSLRFDAAADEAAYAYFRADNYGSGNLTLDIDWESDSATTGDVVWSCAIAVITPNTDSQDIETKAFATAQTVTDSHLGTTGQRLHRASITISNLDSIAAGDWVCLRVRRLGTDGSDTMTGDAQLVFAELSYSDT